MELILKLHEKVSPDWFGFQEEFQNTNIGFGKLDLLKQYEVSASDARLPREELVALLMREIQAGRFPLVSLPRYWMHDLVTGGRGPYGFHIWSAIPVTGSFCLVSGGNDNFSPVVLPDFNIVMERIHHYEPDYLIHHATYTLERN